MLKYRPEIDGLRAFAVLSVILNHAKFSWVSGGYVGVDVFFVISGFLISKIVVDENDRGSFSIIDFYERRLRRIVPALVVVIAASFAAAYFTLLPDDFENFAQSVVATMLFSNNILLTLTSGYWELASDFKPLLHTWSLGVEEQFYLLYPLIALVILRLNKSLFPVFLFVAIGLSFAASVHQTPVAPNAAFYLLHTRAWELLLGALAALYAARLADGASNTFCNIASLAGLALLIGSVVGLNETIAYPSYFAALPCLGTTLVLIYGFPTTVVGRLMSTRILVGVGLISYSAYLWHQPLFAFARATSLSEPGAATMTALSLATLGLAYVSWRLVEQPFRDRRIISRWPMFGLSVAASATLVLAGLGVYLRSGLPERVPGLGLDQGNYIAYNERVYDLKKDRFETDRPRLLVIGNSQGRDLANVVLESERFSHVEVIYRDDLDICGADHLNQENGDLYQKADFIFLATNWTYDNECSNLNLTSSILAAKPFIVVGPKHFGYNLNAYMRLSADDRLKARARLLDDTVRSNELYARDIIPGHYVDVLRIANERYGGIPIFDEYGRILSVDRVHLTKAGAEYFDFIFEAQAFAPVLKVINERSTLKPDS